MNANDTKSKSDITYRQDVFLLKNEIISEFEVDADFVSAEMFTAVENEDTRIMVGGFEHSEYTEPKDNNDFKTPHGPYIEAFIHTSLSPKRLGYKVIFSV